MATIQYIAYKFHKPPPLTMSDYYFMKNLLNSNPKMNIVPKTDIINLLKYHFTVFGIFAIFIVITVVFEEKYNWLGVIGGIAGLFALVTLIHFLFSFSSYVSFAVERAKFYSKLKKDIIKSIGFDESRKSRI